MLYKEIPMEVLVLIVGAGPSGLAVSACLNLLHIPNIVLEREDCFAPLWKKKTYDRLKLHLAKEFCELPYMSFPFDAPKFVPKQGFIDYLDDYVAHFGINPKLSRVVKSATFDVDEGKWHVEVKNTASETTEVYVSKFLVAATGENSEGFIPRVPGLENFDGEHLHSSDFENGKKYSGKDVLVVGVGNSGMEIAYDLSNAKARTSILARSPVHILNKELVYLAMVLLKMSVAPKQVDKLIMGLSKIKNGNIKKYGLQRPKEGPFQTKAKTGRSPTIDVGCLKRIKQGRIDVYSSSIANIKGSKVEFENGETRLFDAIVFATGYRSTVRDWLKESGGLFDDNGFPKAELENKWKGMKGLYCVGFARNGLFAISRDAKRVAEDISLVLKNRN